jgi:mono/diheme cytochrome c family protein
LPLIAAALLIHPAASAADQDDDRIARVYAQNCAACHGADRLGGIGPALLPENLRRLKPKKAAAAIRNGLPASQMPGFADKLSGADIDGLAKLIYTPLPRLPMWGEEQIASSRIVHASPAAAGTKPRHDSDPLNLFVVVETGDHHVTVLDGDSLTPIHRFKSRYALHGGPKFSPDGRFVYFASRDGWVSMFDLHRLQMLVEVRAGINTRNLAVSGDGRYAMVANYLPHSLVILNATDLTIEQVIPVEDDDGVSSRVSAVYDAAPRESFIVALKDLKELWEIQYGDEPVFYGFVHDYRIEGVPEQTERFPIRRIRLDDYLDDFFFDPEYEHIVGAARDAGNGQVVNLTVGRKIAEIDLPGLPHLGSGITWDYGDAPVVATPNLRDAVVSVIDMRTSARTATPCTSSTSRA